MLNGLNALHHRVRRLHDLGRELAGAMPLELRRRRARCIARELVNIRRRRVQRHEALAALDEVEERLLLRRA